MEQSLQETPRAVENLGTSLSADSVTVFLQVGKHVKKVTVEKPVSLSALRLLFMEKFEYDPGMEDFPDVYLRDTKTGVQFELEDMDDVSERCLLLLNIEREFCQGQYVLEAKDLQPSTRSSNTLTSPLAR